jgi:hypothetical protein
MHAQTKRLKLKPSCVQALKEVAALGEVAHESGLRLRITTPHRPGRRSTLHFLIDNEATGKRVLDYWPGTGRWRTPTGSHTGVESSALTVLLLAARLRRGENPSLEANSQPI